jgi:NAD(P)-dependent dehydrogenase (short-subunit alcohol dehydrogenase family)
MFSLKGRGAIITGGAGALGVACAKALVEMEADVLLIGRSEDKLLSAKQFLGEASCSRIEFLVCDVTNEDSLNSAAAQIFKESIKTDILVTAAAASASSKPFQDLSLADWRAMTSTDLDGVFLACKVFGTAMAKAGFGRIINLTSFHSVATYPYRVPYNAAKAGVEGLSRALAVEWGHRGVTVNTVAPGPILTPRTQWFIEQDEGNLAGMLSRTPNKRLGTSADVGATVVFLAASESGQRLVVDGGWTTNAWWGSHQDLKYI